MTRLYFESWEALLRPIAVGVPAYVALVASLRISGKRTLSKMNAFDLIVTVSLGSTLATVLLSKDVALAEGVLSFGLLIGLQFAVDVDERPISPGSARWSRGNPGCSSIAASPSPTR